MIDLLFDIGQVLGVLGLVYGWFLTLNVGAKNGEAPTAEGSKAAVDHLNLA